MNLNRADKARLVAGFVAIAATVLCAFSSREDALLPTPMVEAWESEAFEAAAQALPASAGEHDVAPGLLHQLADAGIDTDGLLRTLIAHGVPTHTFLAVPIPAAMLDDAQLRERACLTQAIYYEARNQKVLGRIAVADVVLNRVADKRFPSTICGVVFQGVKSGRGCQFSFACDGSMRKAREPRAWKAAEALGDVIFRGFRPPLTRYATFYHADYVDPYWAQVFNTTTTIGDHIFYRPPGALRMAANDLGINSEPTRS